ncbi:hypothetical protein FRC02_002007 [Tulasnella sp. 418]|nr:hypothetical protein FRC02_002007 [Tulasnella sp. 418]
MYQYQPSLPPLVQLSPSLSELVFTHRGFYGQPRRGNEAPQDYERLEFLGEGILQGCISKILYKRMSRTKASILKNERLRLTKKELLASFSDEYNFIDNIRCADNDRINLKNSVETRSALFKSYVGGLAVQDGFEAALHWVEGVLRHQDPQTFSPTELTPRRSGAFGGALEQDWRGTPMTTATTLHDLDDPYRSYTITPIGSPATTMFSPRSDHLSLSRSSGIYSLASLSAGLPDEDELPPRTISSRSNTRSISDGPIPDTSFEVKPPRTSPFLNTNRNKDNPPHLISSTTPTKFSQPSAPLPPLFSPPPKEVPIPSDWGSTSAADQNTDIPLQDLIPAKSITFGTLAKLNEKARTRCVRVEWAFSSKGMGQDIQWTALCSVKGERKGIGVGQSKQVAKELAAQKALEVLKWK